MSNRIDIEYCGSWGYGGTANKLKKTVQQNFPNVEVSCHSAYGVTGSIQVGWIKGTENQVVWQDGRAKTDGSHS